MSDNWQSLGEATAKLLEKVAKEYQQHANRTEEVVICPDNGDGLEIVVLRPISRRTSGDTE